MSDKNYSDPLSSVWIAAAPLALSVGMAALAAAMPVPGAGRMIMAAGSAVLFAAAVAVLVLRVASGEGDHRSLRSRLLMELFVSPRLVLFVGMTAAVVVAVSDGPAEVLRAAGVLAAIVLGIAWFQTAVTSARRD